MQATALHPTAEAIVEAGLRLAEESGLNGMSVDDVVKAAGVAKGTFYVHFANRGEYMATLHRRFHDDLDAEIRQATSGLPPGRERLIAAFEAYLNGCLGRIAVKALLLEVRTEHLVTDAVAARNARNTEIVTRDLEIMGWEDAAAAGRLCVAMAAEAALAELEAGGPLPQVRRALRGFLSR